MRGKLAGLEMRKCFLHDNEDILLAYLITLLTEADNGNCFPTYKTDTTWTSKQVRKFFYHVKAEKVKVNTKKLDVPTAYRVNSLDTCQVSLSYHV